jgi:geranylgeranyl pyrophosphate synthase
MQRALAGEFEGQQKIDAVRGVYDALNLKERLSELVADYTNKAIAALDKVEMSDESRTYFVSLAKKLNNRAN